MVLVFLRVENEEDEYLLEIERGSFSSGALFLSKAHFLLRILEHVFSICNVFDLSPWMYFQQLQQGILDVSLPLGKLCHRGSVGSTIRERERGIISWGVARVGNVQCPCLYQKKAHLVVIERSTVWIHGSSGEYVQLREMPLSDWDILSTLDSWN